MANQCGVDPWYDGPRRQGWRSTTLDDGEQSEQKVNQRWRMNVVWTVYDGPRRRGWCSTTLDDGEQSEQKVNKRWRMMSMWTVV